MRANAFVLAAVCLMPAPALAQFAEPPPGEVAVPIASEGSDPDPWQPDWRASPDSAVRVHIGPALDVVHGLPGFHAALDIGRNAGFRAATSFVALGSDGGSAIYSGELWLCPLSVGILRPIAAAGAGYRDASREDGDRTHHQRSGVAVLRGGFELLLPTRDIDSRAGLAIAGYLPAIVSESDDSDPSALLTASLAIGF
jgi:hypothetical protein